ncbi:hypothetical protein CF15_04780 [Pyrodictium occultum]|uniref:Uncharacterized protein n=1 Tax=Pyrodictium occultum TaxID=2309 RepID=A0A0V8RVL2_PYROC|nr:hypothetical protein [Pyrodictium occultum]KSW12092.1 hypothetical protein CF15_04780 [Pyrodictium occultum]
MPRNRRLDDYLRELGAAVHSRQVDVEELIRRVAEEAAREAGGGCGEGADKALLERLERIEERLEAIERRLEALERRGGGLTRRDVEELARAISAAVAQALRQAQGSRAREEPAWLRAVAERLRGRGYVLLHELPPEAREGFDPEEARRRGLVVAGLGGETVVLTRQGLREFLERLRGLRASDEYEAEAQMGRYKALFRLLREEGLVYYAGPGRGWVVQGSLGRMLAEEKLV